MQQQRSIRAFSETQKHSIYEHRIKSNYNNDDKLLTAFCSEVSGSRFTGND